MKKEKTNILKAAEYKYYVRVPNATTLEKKGLSFRKNKEGVSLIIK